MSSNTQNLLNLFKKLRDKTSDHSAHLTYIRSDVGKQSLVQQMTDADCAVLCEILLELFVSTQNEVNKNQSKRSDEVTSTLQSFVMYYNCRKINFFENVMKIERNKRLKILTFLDTLDSNVIEKIVQDSSTVAFLQDCLRAVKSSDMDWLTCTESVQLSQAETKTLPNNEDLFVNTALKLLYKIYHNALKNAEFNIQQFHPIIFEKIMTLAYMGHKKQRSSALKVLNDAINTNLRAFIQEKHPDLWSDYKRTLGTTYCGRMSLLVQTAEADWSELWCISVQLLGVDLHRGHELINHLLGVEEKAFKSIDMNVRRHAFKAWKKLIDNFALDRNELTTRRIKLLCTPLNANNSKSEMLTLTKLEVWWYLIIKIYPNIHKFVDQVVQQFLYFCFGPLGDTPLLSTKANVISPGNRSVKSRVLSVDALLQLLVLDVNDRKNLPYLLGIRLPQAVSNTVFQSCYKRFCHSVGEAVLIMKNLTDADLDNRENLIKMLWINLMSHIDQSKVEQKDMMYQELILVIGELTPHLQNSTLIHDLLLNVIIPELCEVIQHLMYRDQTLMDLMVVLSSTTILSKATKENWSSLKKLIRQAIKPENIIVYHPDTLKFVKKMLNQMQIAVDDEQTHAGVFELWCTLTKSIIKFIEDKQQINEGGVSHNFEAIESLICFPIHNHFWHDDVQLKKIERLWKVLYNQFELQADLIESVKPHELLNFVTKNMILALEKDNNSSEFIIHCLDVLMANINYESFLAENQVPPLINLLKCVTDIAFENKKLEEIELTLKAISSLLITVFGLNQNKIMIYLLALKDNIVSMLKFPTVETVEKEIINTWETVIVIFRGLSKSLTRTMLLNYKEAILLALCHENVEISIQASSLMEISKDMNEEARISLEKIFSEAESEMKMRAKLSELPKVKDKSKVKLVGSFLDRRPASPKVLKKVEVKRFVPTAVESNSADYVVIQTDVKSNIKCLTERQKESLKRLPDDIPAMYNDLSQSGSRNTQDVEDWFKNKTMTINEPMQVGTDSESNKANGLKTAAEAPEADAQQPTGSKSATVIIENAKILPETQTSPLTDDANSSTDKQIDNNDTGIGESIVKKLDFESREEFPDSDQSMESDENFQHRKSSPVQYAFRGLRSLGRRGRSNGRSLRRKTEDIPETAVVTPITRRGRGRPRGRLIADSPRSTRSSAESDGISKIAYNLKRKSSYYNDEQYSPKKRRRGVSSDDTTSTESDSLTDSESEEVQIDENLPERTKKEMSRLRIDMAFDCKKSSQKRKKPVDDSIYSKRYSADSKTLRQRMKLHESAPSEHSQELVMTRRRRHTMHDLKTHTIDIENIKDSSVEDEDNPQSPVRCSADDDEEVVHSSQDTNPILRSPLRKSLERKFESPTKLIKSPSKDVTASIDKTCSVSTTSDQDNTKNSPTKIAPIFNYSSPKSIKRKSQTFTPISRGAHMLGLVTKTAINEKNEETQKITGIDMINKKLLKDGVELIACKKERPLIPKEPDKIGSPSGSRQEKIFNNMKNRDLTSSPPPILKLFNNLKNDGEKVSPKEKNPIRESCDSDGIDIKDSDCSTSFEQESLPMLEWSSANPPNLMASPSSSILKRTKTLPVEIESEMLNKKKRVSFTDPPVSKRMGYEVISTMSPSNTNKFGSPRSIVGRKDTPLRMKQQKIGSIVRSHLIASSKPKSLTMNQNSENKNENLTDKIDEVDLTAMDITDDVDGIENDSEIIRVSLDIREDDDTDSAEDIEEIVEIKPSTSHETSTQDIFPESQAKISPEPLRQVDTTDISLALDTFDVATKSNTLEDTVDIQNVSNLNSTGNSDEFICSKPARTSTAMVAICEGDTLPVTDSILFSQGSSCQGTQQSLSLPQPELMDSTNPIHPNLLDCTEPIGLIVDSLVNPQWSQNLSNYFASRSINTIGKLAQLSEREVARIPMKGSPKADHVRSVLDKFYLSNVMAMGKASSTPRKKLDITDESKINIRHFVDSSLSLENPDISGCSSLDDKSNIDIDEMKIEAPEEEIPNISGYSLLEINKTDVEMAVNIAGTKGNVDDVRTKQENNRFIDTSIETPTKKTVDAETMTKTVEQLLDDIDATLVLQSAMKRCTSEAIFAQYKTKNKSKSDGELAKEVLRLLDIDTVNETSLKAACRELGLTKVLGRLVNYNSTDKEYFTKVLQTYRMKIKANDCLNALNFDELKKAVTIKSSAQEMCDMMTTVLTKEKKQGIYTPITDTSCMNAMLRRMPIDLIISQTVANDELIPAGNVLEIALQNNPTDIAAVTIEQYPEIVKKILNKNQTMISYIKDENLSKEKLLELHQAVCDKLSCEELINANHKILQQKLGFTTDKQ